MQFAAAAAAVAVAASHSIARRLMLLPRPLQATGRLSVNDTLCEKFNFIPHFSPVRQFAGRRSEWLLGSICVELSFVFTSMSLALQQQQPLEVARTNVQSAPPVTLELHLPVWIDQLHPLLAAVVGDAVLDQNIVASWWAQRVRRQ